MYVRYLIPDSFAFLFPSVIWKIRTSGREFFLTFDDGPDAHTTPYILEILRTYKVKATFFCTGKQVEKYPETAKQIVDEGHGIGHHGYAHIDAWKTGKREFREDYEKSVSVFASLGMDHSLYRPPYGRIPLHSYAYLRRKSQIVMWNVNAADYDRRLTADKSIQILQKAKSGSIILLHDQVKSIEKTQLILTEMIEYWQSKSLSFQTLPERLLPVKEYNTQNNY